MYQYFFKVKVAYEISNSGTQLKRWTTDSDKTKSDVGQSSRSSKPDLIVDPKSEIIGKVNRPAKLKWNKNAPQAYISESSFITRIITPKDLKKLNDKLAERKDWNPITDVAYDYTSHLLGMLRQIALDAGALLHLTESPLVIKVRVDRSSGRKSGRSLDLVSDAD
ncbi:hypothetical protein GIB67_040805 [Kingdonia uniflora]|uniref:Uncharacterized protein n=1 Tax=Kingdonia uniflora TaxID=39325 RepID=A0A7J7P4W5_9MAGN|nr:hypothetical protein GIB67_040805 [Kingdonia uniflora]